MRNKIFLLTSVGIGIAIWFYASQRPDAQQPAAVTAPSTSESEQEDPDSSQEAAPTEEIALEETTATEVPDSPECLADYQQAASLEAPELAELFNKDDQWMTRCKLGSAQQNQFDQISKACKAGAGGEIEDKATCYDLLAHFRLHAVDRSTSDAESLRSIPTPILSMKALSRFTNKDYATTDKKRQLLQMSLELASRKDVPIDSEGMVAMALLTASEDKALVQAEDLQQAMSQANELYPESRDVEEAILVLLVEMDPSGAKIERYASEHSRSASALYFQAMQLWAKGSKEAAIEVLSKAQSLQPNDPRIAESLAAAKSGTKTVQFKSRFSFDYDL